MSKQNPIDEPFIEDVSDDPFADDEETGERAADPAPDRIEEAEAVEEAQQAIVRLVDTTPAVQGDMTKEEAEHTLSQLLGTVERQKQLLLDLYERKGHWAIYGRGVSWELFAEERLGMSRAHFFRQLNIARAERTLGVSTSSSTSSLRKIAPNMAEQVFVELGRLEKPELIQKAWKEMLEAAPRLTHRGEDSHHNGKITAKYAKKVVDALLEMGEAKPQGQTLTEEPSVSPAPKLAPAPEQTSAPMRAVETNTPEPKATPTVEPASVAPQQAENTPFVVDAPLVKIEQISAGVSRVVGRLPDGGLVRILVRDGNHEEE